MSEEVATSSFPKRMTPAVRQVAFFDAQGMTSKKIAEITEMSEAYIRKLRGWDLYQEQVAAWQREVIAQIEPIVLRVKGSWLQTNEDLIKRLQEAAEAVDGEGRPNWPVRLAALKEWRQMLQAIIIAGAAKEAGAGGANVAAAVTHLHVTLPGNTTPEGIIIDQEPEEG